MTSFLTALAVVIVILMLGIFTAEVQFYFLRNDRKWLALFVPMIPPFLMLWWVFWYTGL
jgi:hypothetical protein